MVYEIYYEAEEGKVSGSTKLVVPQKNYEEEEVKEMFEKVKKRIDTEILNGNERIQGIGTLKPSPRGFCTFYSPNSKYYGKCLKYSITNLNESDFDNCGN